MCCYLPYLSACGPPQNSPDPSPGLRAAQEGLQEPQEGLEELIFYEISVIWVQAGYFGSGKTLGGLFWPRKNLGGRYFGTEKNMRMCAFWKFDAQTLYFWYIGNPQRSSFVTPEYLSGLVHGPVIERSPVRVPAPRRSFRGHLFVNFGMSLDVSGSGLGTFSDGFESMSGGVEK